ncbi:MAG: type II toxin-antitoxin system HicB family antitoxin [Pseudanabaena sp. CAN_BIN31]|nr:type II toxin-antitoxin system HicB family antitoxin [Pseudanabaena sp. CAN_BIN31]
MEILNYKGYAGDVEIDSDANVLHGRVLDIRDLITFQGKTVEEIKLDFQDSVDDYLAFCAELGKDPENPYSGKLLFQTTPEHHRLIHLAATKVGKSINAWMDEVLTQEAKQIIN